MWYIDLGLKELYKVLYIKNLSFSFYSLPKTCLLISERRKGRERERNIDVRERHRMVASSTCPTGDKTHILGMCPNQELNLQPFGLWDNVQPTEPHWPGPHPLFLKRCYVLVLLKKKKPVHIIFSFNIYII